MNDNHAAIVEKSIEFFFSLRKAEPSIEPEDGLIYALEEMGLDGKLDDDDYASVLRSVEIQALTKQFEMDKELETLYGYETLAERTYKAAFTNFAKCEGNWLPVKNEDCWKFIESARNVVETMGYPREAVAEFERVAANEKLEGGNVLSLPGFFLRKRTEREKCPLCGGSIMEDVPALSRIDNKTRICGACGMKEAMQDFLNSIDD